MTFVNFNACWFQIQTSPYKALRYVLYEDIAIFLFILILDLTLVATQSSGFQNMCQYQVKQQICILALSSPHIIICVLFLIFLDCWLKSGTIICRFNLWFAWRVLYFFNMIIFEVIVEIVFFYGWFKEEGHDDFLKNMGITQNEYILTNVWAVARIALHIYLIFVFRSFPKFLNALNRSDDFDGENFKNESQSDSERLHAKKRRIKFEAQQKIAKKTEEQRISDIISQKLRKYLDFSYLKKPRKVKTKIVEVQSEKDLPPVNISYVFLLVKNQAGKLL